MAAAVGPLSGHLWTLGSRLIRPPVLAEGAPWAATLEDPEVGSVRLTGRLTVPEGAQELVVVVHGLGGCAESHYMAATARAAAAARVACLRLNLRGADRLGEDYYHAGLTADLAGALASPEVGGFGRVYVLGFSLGGHMVLRWAGTDWQGPDRPGAVAAVAAISAPLDLSLLADHSQQRWYWPYRRYVLRRLTEIYAAVARRRPVPVPVEEVAQIRGFREWDRRVVVPRHGFADAEDYYRRASAAPVLGAVAGPTLYVGSDRDPMVPPAVVRPALEAAGSKVQTRWIHRGGHLAYPRSLLLEAEVLAWLRHGREPSVAGV